MPRSNLTGVRKGDIQRAIAGARAAGIAVAKIEIDPTKKLITIIAGDPSASPTDDLDAELKAFEARNEGNT
jgi:hypothetical protein